MGEDARACTSLSLTVWMAYYMRRRRLLRSTMLIRTWSKNVRFTVCHCDAGAILFLRASARAIINWVAADDCMRGGNWVKRKHSIACSARIWLLKRKPLWITSDIRKNRAFGRLDEKGQQSNGTAAARLFARIGFCKRPRRRLIRLFFMSNHALVHFARCWCSKWTCCCVGYFSCSDFFMSD